MNRKTWKALWSAHRASSRNVSQFTAAEYRSRIDAAVVAGRGLQDRYGDIIDRIIYARPDALVSKHRGAALMIYLGW